LNIFRASLLISGHLRTSYKFHKFQDDIGEGLFYQMNEANPCFNLRTTALLVVKVLQWQKIK